MTVLNKVELERFMAKHADAADWIRNWVEVTESAEWHSIVDVRMSFPHADAVYFRKTKVTITIFNVKGNEYRLLTVIRYAQQEVFVRRALSHAEYDKRKWKRPL
ncbi:MAG TPA: type II toxin-antitoxin system HigB family toxin [Tepidisphaeraceae bacterium]|jgi:mRNA interferase HigB|nr:type II toxin-antitoxin system HigB family toxin [Tepidisphaeraceae bacterium]